MSSWHCPWCGATSRSRPGECPAACGWTAAGHVASLAAVAVDGVHFAATGSNPARARESLGMALRAAGLAPVLSGQATILDAPDAGPWSFRWERGPFVAVSRPGALEVDVVDLWDSFDFYWARTDVLTEFLRLCRRWVIDWADRFELEGE